MPRDGLLPQALRLPGTVGMVFLLLSPKSETAWLVMFLPGVLFLVENTKGWTHRFLLYGFLPVCTFETSMWWYFDQGATISDVAWGRPVMLAVEAILLAGYGVLVRHGLRLREAELPRGASVATFAMPRVIDGSHP